MRLHGFIPAFFPQRTAGQARSLSRPDGNASTQVGQGKGGGVIPRAVGGADCSKQIHISGATDQRPIAEQSSCGGGRTCKSLDLACESVALHESLHNLRVGGVGWQPHGLG